MGGDPQPLIPWTGGGSGFAFGSAVTSPASSIQDLGGWDLFADPRYLRLAVFD